MISAEQAHAVAKEVSLHLQTLVVNMSDLRRENTEQHKENGVKMDTGFKDLHSRVSSVKTELSEVKTAVEINKVAATKAAEDAQTGALKKVEGTVQGWKDRLLKILAWTCVGLLLTLIANLTHIKIVLPWG